MKLLATFGCLALALFFAGCENFDYFRSEDDLNKNIQGRWTMVQLPKTNPIEYWTFDNGIVYRQKGVNPALYDTGTYSISADFDDAVLDIKDFTHIKDSMVDPWDIVRLDESILFIATDKNGYPGITQREFYK